MEKEGFNEKLINLLKTNPDFIDESGELLPAVVKDKAWRLDHDLVKLMLSDPDIKTMAHVKSKCYFLKVMLEC